MNEWHRYAWVVALTFFLTAGCAARTHPVTERDAAAARTLVADAEQVLERHLADKGGDALRALLCRARGVLIIPSAHEFGLILSLGSGAGVLLANTDKGWTGPVFMTRESVGWGWQVGGYSQSGVVLFMHEDDVRYVMETGAVLKGQARIVFLSTDQEYGQSPEFRTAGDVYFVGNKSGLFVGVAFDAGGYSDRPVLNEALSGVAGGDPEAVLYKAKARPEAAARLRELIGCAVLSGALIKEKDGAEAPSR